MVKFQYKISLVAGAILVLVCTGFVWSAGTVTDANEAPFLLTSQSSSNGLKNPGSLDEDYSITLYRVIAATLIVFMLGIAAMYASKKLLPKWSATQGKKIKIVETIHLGTRKTVHLLEVGDQQILIGTTPDSITKLADIFSEKGFPLGRTDHREEAE